MNNIKLICKCTRKSDIIIYEIHEQEDLCIEQDNLVTQQMIYPEYDNKIPFQVAFGCKYQLFV